MHSLRPLHKDLVSKAYALFYTGTPQGSDDRRQPTHIQRVYSSSSTRGVMDSLSMANIGSELSMASLAHANNELQAPGRLCSVPQHGVPEESEDTICERCLSIPWRRLAQTDYTSADGYLRSKVENVIKIDCNTLAAAACPMCRLLSQLLPVDYAEAGLPIQADLQISRLAYWMSTEAEHMQDNLIAIGVNFYGSLGRFRWFDKLWFHGLLILTEAKTPALDAASIVSPSEINYRFVEDCLAACESCHGKACSTNTVSSLDTLPGLRLIHCESGKVVDAPHHGVYLALSYVWGSSALSSDGKTPERPNVFHPVVRDSIEFTRRLGVPYLWVDRHVSYISFFVQSMHVTHISRPQAHHRTPKCIDQHGPHKTAQIAQMDEIYARAKATIVALAGDGPHYGLPGVAGRPRHQWASITVDDNQVTCVPGKVAHVVERSAWTSRGWTFQEAILSARRILFADDQIVFLCNSRCTLEAFPLCAYESVGIPPQLATLIRREPIRHDPRPKKRIRNKILLPRREYRQNRYLEFRNSAYAALTQWRTYVNAFVQRHLTFESDALFAITGVLHSMEENGCFHLQGLLCMRDTCDENEAGIDSSSASIWLFALLWTASGRLRRRPGMPSWSWTGWSFLVEDVGNKIADRYQELDNGSTRRPGRVLFHGSLLKTVLGTCEIFAVDRVSQAAVPFSTIEAMSNRQRLEMDPSILRITGEFIDIAAQEVNWSDPPEGWPGRSTDGSQNPHLGDGPYVVLPIGRDARSYDKFLVDRLFVAEQGASPSDWKQPIGLLCIDEGSSGMEVISDRRFILVLSATKFAGVYERVGWWWPSDDPHVWLPQRSLLPFYWDPEGTFSISGSTTRTIDLC